MEVVIPVQNMDFDFNRGPSSSYLTAPSTPRGFGQFYFSAPTSPTHFSGFDRDFGNLLIVNSGASNPCMPESPKECSSARHSCHYYENDFAFDVSEEMEFNSLSAEELFDGGKIKPLKPPPIQKEADPFSSVSENTRKIKTEENRGRERNSSLSSSNSGRSRATRSLSPLRVSECPWEEENQLQNNPKQQSSTSSKSYGLSSSASKGSRKWRLRDFFLFRSASEGRATDKYGPKKYRDVDVKSSSFRVVDSVGSGSGSRRRGAVSAHELHYTTNRAVSEDLKKKTFLPYKQGILGRLAFNPAVHAIANGFGFSRR